MNNLSLFYNEDLCYTLQFESSFNKNNNYSSKAFSNYLQSSKFIISPKKLDAKNRNSTKENSAIYSPKRNLNNKKKENSNDYRSICRKLDFSDNSNNNCNNSNYSISDNENIEINENYSEDLNECKNTDFSSSSLEEEKSKKRKNYKNKKYYSDKEFTFMKKKKFSGDISIYSNNSRFDEEYVIIKTLCNGEMGTVYLCFRIKDKKKFVVKMSRFFSRKLDLDNMNNFGNDINRHSDDPGSFFIQKYIDFWIEEIYEKTYKSAANSKNIYIVTDYCINGNLKEYISNLKKYNNIKLNYSFYWDIIFQMIIPITFLHKLGYIHFDIKPTNYLVMNNNQLLLNDFCLSIKEENIRNISTDELEGDSMYISPELFYKDIGVITHKIDTFSLGLSILEILTEIELPKNGQTWQQIRNQELPKEFIDKIILIDEDNETRNKFIELIKELTQINNDLRPELDILIKDESKYPELFNRYQLLKKNQYIENIFINVINRNNYIQNICKNSNEEEEKSDSGILCENKENINKMFLKRSNSMKIVAQNSSSEDNFFESKN